MRGEARWLFLTGMMGAGKTSVGQRLAESLGWKFVDLDEEIEASSERSITSWFSDVGEDAFRDEERKQLQRLLFSEQMSDANSSGIVLALGGGTYIQDGVPALLSASGPVVCLEVPVDELIERLTSEDVEQRPLLKSASLKETLTSLWELRRDRYRMADHVIDASGLETDAVCVKTLQELGRENALEGFTALEVDLGARSYPIWIGEGGVTQAAKMVHTSLSVMTPQPSRLFVVTDDHVAPLYLRAFMDEMSHWESEAIVVPNGESSKSLEALNQLLNDLLKARIGRRDLVIALGGGVVGDLAGFASSILLRGVRFVQVPTTVLAQVDSSVGGKTGINHDLGKNLIGAFHQPLGVYMALTMLQTLDERHISSGLAEVVKYAVLDSDEMLGELEAQAERLRLSPETFPGLFARCCAIKARIVALDETEVGGKRILLNLGHTFGHAIERMGDCGETAHGEAIALGMLLAARSSRILGLIEEGQAELEVRLEALFQRLKLPTDPKPYLRQQRLMLEFMAQDKKAQGGEVTLILPVTAGDVKLYRLSLGDLAELLNQLVSSYNGG